MHNRRALRPVILVASPVAQRRQRWMQPLKKRAHLHEAADESGVRKSLASLRPEIILLDLAAEQPKGALVDELLRASPSTRVILFSRTPSQKQGIAMLRKGVKGYCSVSIQPALLRKAVERVQEGEIWVGRKLVSRLLDELTMLVEGRTAPLPTASAAGSSLARLSVREQQIVRHIGLGASNKEIANQLNLSEKTVKARLTDLYRKLGVLGRLHLAILVNRAHPEGLPLPAAEGTRPRTESVGGLDR